MFLYFKYLYSGLFNMICVIALIIFGILGIFSAKYRVYAKEAFYCVSRRITLRPCETKFDQKLKMKITGKLMRIPRLARFVYRHFEAISWVFTITFITTTAYTVYSGYNYYLYGNCYGPESTGFCPYAIFEETYSPTNLTYYGERIFPTMDDDAVLGPDDAKVIIIEFGCYMCPYTKKAEPTVKEILKRYENRVKYVFRDFPIHRHAEAELHSIAANCAKEQGKFWEYHDKLFEKQDLCKNMTHEEMLMMFTDIANELGLDKDVFDSCLLSEKYKNEVEKDFQDGVKAGVMGTPTFFINNRTIIGPKPILAFTTIIDEELRKQ